MRNLLQARQALEVRKAEGRAILDKAMAEDRRLDAEEDAEAATIKADVEAITAEVRDLEARGDLERAMAPASDPLARAAGYDPAEDPDAVRPSMGTGGYLTFAEFALDVMHAGAQPAHVSDRLAMLYAAPSGQMQGGGGTAQEGFMIPTDFRNEIYELMFSDATFNLLSRTDIEPTNSNSVEWDADETTPWGTTGVQAKWRAEADQMTGTKLVTKGRRVELDQLYAFVLATDELLADAPRLNSRITRKSAEALRWKASDAVIWGSGAGQPLGFMNAGSSISVAKESEQAAATVTAMNVAQMFARMLPDSIQRAIWLMQSDVFPQLPSMTVGDAPIWAPPATGIAGAPGGFLFGRPIEFSQHAETLGTVGDIQLVDPMGWAGFRKAEAIQSASSIHLFFDYGIEAFRHTMRFGGRPKLEAAVSPKRGSATQGHHVTLATRA